ncbi:MAG TPA: DUF4249 family protein [Cyclobacteriaceae bacterium]|nr:DUF4249 family protein [Cyclobacteriaceae bacterium]
MRKLLPFIISALLINCDPGVDLDSIRIDNLLAVSSFISPQDSTHKVFLFRASEVGDVENYKSAVVQGALVILSDGVTADTLHLNNDLAYYATNTSNVNVKEFGTYHLSIKVGEDPILNASCTIPPDPGTPSVNGTREGDDFRFQVIWENVDQHPYYVLSAFAEGQYERESPFGPVTSNLRADMEQTPIPANDQQSSNTGSGKVANAFLPEEASLTATVWNVDEDMYTYYKTYDDYFIWIVNSTGSIPNFNEPYPIYSNITNGVGIFAGFNTSSTTRKIK